MSCEEHESLAMNDGHRLVRSPPNPPFVGRQSGRNDRSNNGNGSLLSRLFKKPTVEPPVIDPQLQVYACRWPECKFLVRNDQMVRLGGYCCTTQMVWVALSHLRKLSLFSDSTIRDAINNGVVKQCRCQRVFPEGNDYCSPASSDLQSTC